jgi:hypothetical protein
MLLQEGTPIALRVMTIQYRHSNGEIENVLQKMKSAPLADALRVTTPTVFFLPFGPTLSI